MYPRSGAVSRPDESATHDLNERRLPTPVNHFNTLRPPPPGPPSSRSFPPTLFRSEISSGPISISASQGHSNYGHLPVSGPSTPWTLSTGVPHTQGSSGSMAVSATHHNLNSGPPLISGPPASWATVMPYTHAPGAPAARPTQNNHSHYDQRQPWVPGLSASWTAPTDVSRSHGSSGGASKPFDYYYHTFPQPDLMSQTPRAIKRRRQKLSSAETVPQSQHSVTGSSTTSGYASSVPDGSLDEYSPSLVDRVIPDRGISDRATSRARSSSPEVNLNIILEDPKSGQLYREKRIRSQDELDSQKEGMRILKDNGGACAACYKSKKRCGPGDPCPPCAVRNRKCVRLNRYDGEIVSAADQPVSAPAQPVSLSSQQSASASPQSTSPPTQPVSAPACPLSPSVRFESLTLVQITLTNGPSLPERNPVEPALNEDPPSVDPDQFYFDPFCNDSWEAGMLCIDSAYDSLSYSWVDADTGGHLATWN